mmetsp:Transcript_15422/g.43137  ORF Transcript_15422/g.43137 Transcript_15422/m.43137 type:complete len:331 (-) Transcript_15422:1164-2156(-)
MRELYGVGQQVQQHLLDTVGIGAHDGVHAIVDERDDLEALLGSAHHDGVERLLHRLGNPKLHWVQHQLTALDACDVKDIVDEAKQRLSAGLHHLCQLRLLVREVRGEQQLVDPQDSVERCPHLVAHVRQKLALGVVGCLGLAQLHLCLHYPPGLRDVLQQHHRPHDVPPDVAPRAGVQQNKQLAARLGADVEAIGRHPFALLQHTPQQRPQRLLQLQAYEAGHQLSPDSLVPAEPQHLAGLLVPLGQLAVSVHSQDGRVGSVNKHPKVVGQLGLGDLRLLAGCNVLAEGHHAHALPRGAALRAHAHQRLHGLALAGDQLAFEAIGGPSVQ